jgi:hypothetical protein
VGDDRVLDRQRQHVAAHIELQGDVALVGAGDPGVVDEVAVLELHLRRLAVGLEELLEGVPDVAAVGPLCVGRGDDGVAVLRARAREQLAEDGRVGGAGAEVVEPDEQREAALGDRLVDRPGRIGRERRDDAVDDVLAEGVIDAVGAVDADVGLLGAAHGLAVRAEIGLRGVPVEVEAVVLPGVGVGRAVAV